MPRSQAFFAWLWLLLAAIGAHAMLPVGSPEAPTRGSAFSASTVEVALQPRRRAAAADSRITQPRPDGPADVAQAALPVAALVPEMPAPAPAAPLARAPPPDVTPAGLTVADTFPARAPPAA